MCLYSLFSMNLTMIVNIRILQRLQTVRCLATSAIPQDHVTEWESARPYSEVPGPKPLPIIGNIHRFLPIIGNIELSDFPKTIDKLHREYGNIVKLCGIPKGNDLLFIYDPADMETVYRNEGIWPIRPKIPTIEYYRKVARKDFFEGHGGVLVDQGEAWQQARSQVNPVMMQTRTVQLYVGGISDVAEEFVTRIPELRDKNGKLPDTFQNELHKWALESIALIALDTRLGCLAPNLTHDAEPQLMIDALQTTFQCIHKLDMGPQLWRFFPSPTLQKLIDAFDYFTDVSMKYVELAIKRYEVKGDTDESVLGRFLAKDPNPKRAVVMVLDMLAAGIDTTTVALTNVLLLLSKNQEKQEKLFMELYRLMPDPSMPLTNELLNEMRYLKACIRESMRIQPAFLGNSRTSQEKMVLSNFRIPKNVDIVMPGYYLSVMEQYFPRANEYLPERWLRNSPENPFQGSKVNPFVSLPFGHGARKCVGMRFASLELEVLLAKLIRRFRWEWHNPPMKYKALLMNMPIDPLQFTVLPRQQP